MCVVEATPRCLLPCCTQTCTPADVYTNNPKPAPPLAPEDHPLTHLPRLIAAARNRNNPEAINRAVGSRPAVSEPTSLSGDVLKHQPTTSTCHEEYAVTSHPGGDNSINFGGLEPNVLLEDMIKTFSADMSNATKNHISQFMRNTYKDGWETRIRVRKRSRPVLCPRLRTWSTVHGSQENSPS